MTLVKLVHTQRCKLRAKSVARFFHQTNSAGFTSPSFFAPSGSIKYVPMRIIIPSLVEVNRIRHSTCIGDAFILRQEMDRILVRHDGRADVIYLPTSWEFLLAIMNQNIAMKTR